MSEELEKYKALAREFIELRANPESDVEDSEVRQRCFALSGRMSSIWMSLPTVEDMQTAQEWFREQVEAQKKKGDADGV